MLFFFTRDNSRVQLETRFDNRTQEYLVEITWPGRTAPETHRFTDVNTFQVYVKQLEQQLEAERWQQDGNPAILPDGWRGPISH